MPVTIGAITVEIDVSKEIPDLSFQVMSPQLTIPFHGKTIRVQTKPHIEFEDGAIVVKTADCKELKCHLDLFNMNK